VARPPLPSPRPSRPGTSELAAVAVGGAAGGSLRLGFDVAIPGAGPWATLAANLAGCLLLGALSGLLLAARPPEARSWVGPLLTAGVAGSLTTFSTYAVEVLALLRSGRSVAALAYALGSIAVGLTAVVLAALLVRRRLAAR